MAKLPIYTADSSSSAGSTPQVSESIARADYSGISDFGNALQNVAAAGTNVFLQDKAKADQKAKEEQSKFDQQQALRTYSEYQIADSERQNNFKNNYAGKPQEFAKADIEDQQKFYESYQTEPMSKDAADHFTGLYQQHRVRSFNEGLGYQAAATGAEVKRNVQEASDNFINDTRLNPKNYEQNSYLVDSLVDSMNGLVPDSVLQSYRSELKDKNAIALIRGEADKDPRKVVLELEKTAGSYSNVPGLIAPGTINLAQRPTVKNEDGSISTVLSMSVGFDGVEFLIPKIGPNGEKLSDQQAIDLFKKTGEHLGKFKDEKSATAFAEKLHDDQDSFYSSPIAKAALSLSPEAFDVLYSGMKREIEAEDKQQQAQMRADISGQMNDHFASIMETNTPVLKREQVLATGDPELIKEYDFNTRVAHTGYKVLKGTENQPAVERLGLLEPLKPKPGSKNYAEEKQMYDALRNEVFDQEKNYLSDPVQTSMSNAQVAQAYNRSPQEGMKASIVNQLQKGKKNYEIKVASNSEIAQHAATLNDMLSNGDYNKAKAVLDDLKKTYSGVTLPDGRSSWSVFQNQLANSKDSQVSKSFMYAYSFNSDPAGKEIFSAYSTDIKTYKDLLGEDYKTVDTEVSSQLKSYFEVAQKVPGWQSDQTLNEDKVLTTKYAARLVQQGLTPKKAAEKAYKTMHPYTIINNAGNKLAIPAEINGTTINPTIVTSALAELGTVDKLKSFHSTGAQNSGSRKLAKLSLPDNTDPGKPLFLQASAAQSIENIAAGLKSIGKSVKINSANRTFAEQKALYDSGNNGIPVAKPGTSNHEKGMAIDIENYNDPIVKKYLLDNGWVQPPQLQKSDPRHFEYVGPKFKQTADPAERDREATLIAKSGQWVMSPDMMSVTRYYTNKYGAVVPVLNGNQQEYSFSLMDLQKRKLGQLQSIKDQGITAPGLRDLNLKIGSEKDPKKKAQLQKQLTEQLDSIKYLGNQ